METEIVTADKVAGTVQRMSATDMATIPLARSTCGAEVMQETTDW